MSSPPRFDPDAVLGGMRADEKRLPPVLADMRAEVRDYRPVRTDADRVGSSLTIRFPVLERYRTPTGAMQGGVIAAAVDGVVGPLSDLVALPSVAAQLSMTYLVPVATGAAWIEVEARLTARTAHHLVFDAIVRVPDGTEVALGRASQTILRQDEPPSAP